VRGIHSGPLVELWSNSMLFSNGGGIGSGALPCPGRSHSSSSKRCGRGSAPQRGHPAAAPAGRRVGFSGRLCLPDTAHIIANVLGIPTADVPHFTELVYSVSRSLSISFAQAEIQSMQDSARQLMEYVNELLGSRGAALNNEFLASYLKTATEAGTLSAAEILSQIVTIIIAGSDTTRGAIAMQVALLLQHREQWDAVCADPALIPGAVSESLRYEPVVDRFPGSRSRISRSTVMSCLATTS